MANRRRSIERSKFRAQSVDLRRERAREERRRIKAERKRALSAQIYEYGEEGQRWH